MPQNWTTLLVAGGWGLRVCFYAVVSGTSCCWRVDLDLGGTAIRRGFVCSTAGARRGGGSFDVLGGLLAYMFWILRRRLAQLCVAATVATGSFLQLCRRALCL